MNCPRCGKPIAEHEAGRCLDAWVAEKVMELNPGDSRLPPTGIPNLWENDKLIGKQNYRLIYLPKWSPSTSIVDADDIMKKWENEGRLYYLRRSGKKFKIYLGKPNEIDAVYSAEGDTKEITICRAALMASKEE